MDFSLLLFLLPRCFSFDLTAISFDSLSFAACGLVTALFLLLLSCLLFLLVLILLQLPSPLLLLLPLLDESPVTLSLSFRRSISSASPSSRRFDDDGDGRFSVLASGESKYSNADVVVNGTIDGGEEDDDEMEENSCDGDGDGDGGDSADTPKENVR